MKPSKSWMLRMARNKAQVTLVGYAEQHGERGLCATVAVEYRADRAILGPYLAGILAVLCIYQ